MSKRNLVPTDPDAVRQISLRLNDAATLATVLMTQIDDGDISAEMQRRFADTMLMTKAGIEQARQLESAFQAMQQQLIWEQARISVALDQMQLRQRALRDRVRDVIRENPQVTFRDSLGTKVYVRASNPSLKFTFELGKKSVSNIAPADFPAEYTEPVSFRIVNTRAVREALDRGEKLDFAWLEQGQSLCGL